MLGHDRMRPINDQIRTQLATAIHQELELPDGVLISITKVDTAPDLRNATIYVSILPDNQTGTTLEYLRKHLGRLSKAAAGQMNLRVFPKLHVKIDDHERKANQIEELLDSLKE